MSDVTGGQKGQAAAEDFKVAQKEVEAMLVKIRANVRDLAKSQKREPSNWEFVGSMNEVHRQLTATLAFVADEDR